MTIGLTQDEVRGHLAMLGFSALVAGSFSLGVIVANDIAPQAVTAARFILATIVMGMVAALQRDMKPEYMRRPSLFHPWRAVHLLFRADVRRIENGEPGLGGGGFHADAADVGGVWLGSSASGHDPPYGAGARHRGLRRIVGDLPW